MPKNILFCADGTWNSSSEDDNGDNIADPTNVFKLFMNLAGVIAPDLMRKTDQNEQEKALIDGGKVIQVAKYIHGVGDSKNKIESIIGGGTGAGVIKRIVRGYTFISRNYEDGDNIVITGFSRGAYTARALAGMIISEGLLSAKHAEWTDEQKEESYRQGAVVWYKYRNKKKRGQSFLEKLSDLADVLPGFISRTKIESGDLLPIKKIKAVAVWDTVGAMGIPNLFTEKGQSLDTFKFADTVLSSAVEHGFHAVSLDDQRAIFTPTLWDDADNVTQRLFAGAHADVGGGYPAKNNESGLSDITLDWMMANLRGSSGVVFSATPAYKTCPDAGGAAHQPWIHAPFDTPVFIKCPRKFAAGFPVDDSVSQRMKLPSVSSEPGAAAGVYKPTNLPR